MQFGELKLSTKIISYIFISIICLTILYPVIWMSYTALKPNTEVMRSPFGLPTKIDFSNIYEAWTTGNFTRLYFNTLLISVLSVLGIVGFASMAACALARYDFRFRRFFFVYFLIGIGVPTQSLIIPGFKLMAILDVWAKSMYLPFTFRNSPVGLILTYLSWVSIAIVFIRAYYASIPLEMDEAARVDGASEWQIFLKIMVPLTMPAMVTMGIFYFIWIWNDFLWPLVYVQNPEWRTITLGLMNFRGKYTSLWSLQIGALSLATWPPLFLYLIFRKQIQRGLTEGALKF